MGRHIFKLPDVGEGVAEVEIVKWHAAIGDDVREEQPLVDIMTDKATVELAAPVAGRIVSRNGEEGQKLAVGSEFVIFATAGDETVSEAAPVFVATPAASSEPQAIAHPNKVLAPPAVRQRAKAVGVDLANVIGTGPDGQISHNDLDHCLASQRGQTKPVVVHEIPAGGTKIAGLRKRIAERMEIAHKIPHFTYVEEIDVTSLEKLRADLNIKHASRAHLTFLAFIVRALTKCLADHPKFNAHYHAEQGLIQSFSEFNIGIATQTDRGLLVPVIHKANEMDIWQLADAISRVSEAARSGKASLDDLTLSTITVTSLGALGGVAATPIINAPEVAIIGVNKIIERPVVREGKIEIAKMVNLSSSFDHRIVDGFEAATLISAIKASLEHPSALLAGQATAN